MPEFGLSFNPLKYLETNRNHVRVKALTTVRMTNSPPAEVSPNTHT